MANPANTPEIAAAYDRWAETYDTDPNLTRELAHTVLAQLDLKLEGRELIEIGCGTGRNTEWLAGRARAVMALDFSAEMLSKARARVASPQVRFLQHDIRSTWPVADASADLIIVMLVLEHIESLEPVFAEAARALRSGGALFLCELHPMRQISGSQAVFANRDTGEQERISAYLHDISEYVSAGLKCGFELAHLGEWRDADAPRNVMPRLLSLHLILAT